MSIDDGAARGMRKDRQPRRGIERIQSGLVAAVGQIHCHAYRFHSLQDREPEDRKAAIPALQKPAADAVIEVIGQLRHSLAEPEEFGHIVRFAKVPGILCRQQYPDFAFASRSGEVPGRSNPQEQCGVVSGFYLSFAKP